MISIQIRLAIYRKCHLAFEYSKCVQPKLNLIGQIVKLVGKWPMANCYFVLHNIMINSVPVVEPSLPAVLSDTHHRLA